MAKSRGASRLGVGSMNTKVHSFTKALALLGSCVVVANTCGVGGADEKPKAEARAPSAWGLLSANKACVIFREYRKTKVGFWVVVVTAKTHAELEVIEATNGYVMEQKKWVEDEPTMDELQHRAMKDGLRYVKIQDKYTPEELEAARALCQKENVTE